MIRPKVFICHNEVNFRPTEFAIRIVDLIGCTPVIAEKEPKLSRVVSEHVFETMDSCDAVILIATPDEDSPHGKTCSQSVFTELVSLQKSEKFKGRYVVIKEESVAFPKTPMIQIPAYYEFKEPDLSPIAEAILVELGGMKLFRNAYEFYSNDMIIHELTGMLSQLKDAIGQLPKDKADAIIVFIEGFMKGYIKRVREG